MPDVIEILSRMGVAAATGWWRLRRPVAHADEWLAASLE